MILLWVTIAASFLTTCSVAERNHARQGPFTRGGTATKHPTTGNIGPPTRRQDFLGHAGGGPIPAGHIGSQLHGIHSFRNPSEVFSGNAFVGGGEHGPFRGHPPSAPSHILGVPGGGGNGVATPIEIGQSAGVPVGGLQFRDHTRGNHFVNGPFTDHPAGVIRNFERVPFGTGHFIGQPLKVGPFVEAQSGIPENDRHFVRVPTEDGHFPFPGGPINRGHLLGGPPDNGHFPVFNSPPEFGHFTGRPSDNQHFPERPFGESFEGRPPGGHFVGDSQQTQFIGHGGGHFTGRPITEHTLSSGDLHIEEGHKPSGFSNGGGHVAGHEEDRNTHSDLADNHEHIHSVNGDVKVHSEKAITSKHSHPGGAAGDGRLNGGPVAFFISRPFVDGNRQTTVTKVPVKEISFKDAFNQRPNFNPEHAEIAHSGPSSGHSIGVHHAGGPPATHARTQNTVFGDSHHEGSFEDGFKEPNRRVGGPDGEATASINFSFGAPLKSQDGASGGAKHAALDVRDSQS